MEEISHNVLPQSGVTLRRFRHIGKDTHGADDTFLCHESGKGGGNRLPAAEAQRSKDRSEEGADDREEGSFHILNHAEGAVFHAERSQEPHHHTAEEQDCSRFL